MMESIILDDDDGSDTDDTWDHVEPFGGPQTPSTISENLDADRDIRPQQYDTSDVGSDEEYGPQEVSAPRRRKSAYESRIEQILYENPELPIMIVDAGKSQESGGKYIVYTIRTGVC